jgi:hypothetical protein
MVHKCIHTAGIGGHSDLTKVSFKPTYYDLKLIHAMRIFKIFAPATALIGLNLALRHEWLVTLHWSRPTGKTDSRPWVAASASLAWAANGGFRRNPKSAYDFPLVFTRSRCRSACSPQESVAWEIGVFPLGDSNGLEAVVGICDLPAPDRTFPSRDRQAALWWSPRQSGCPDSTNSSHCRVTGVETSNWQPREK